MATWELPQEIRAYRLQKKMEMVTRIIIRTSRVSAKNSLRPCDGRKCTSTRGILDYIDVGRVEIQ